MNDKKERAAAAPISLEAAAQKKTPQEAPEAATVAKKAASAAVYTLDEFSENADVLGANRDIIHAAFRCAKKTSATLEEAKKLVKEFKESEVK